MPDLRLGRHYRSRLRADQPLRRKGRERGGCLPGFGETDARDGRPDATGIHPVRCPERHHHEDGSWGDKKLARYLSKELETRTIWLALATLDGEWGYVVYANGAVADSHFHTTETIEELEMMETTERIYEDAREFASRHALPFALIYLPDPSMPARYELAKKAFQDLLALTPELKGRIEGEYQLEDEDWQPEDLVETEAEVEALKRQRAEMAKFPKLTIPCKQS